MQMINTRFGLAFSLCCLAMLPSTVAHASVSEKQMVSSLQDTLSKGASAAVAKLGTTDGFWKNDKLRIPLPESLQKAERTLQFFGRGKDVEQLKVSINRAAESAVADAKPILVDAIKQMNWQDAKGILQGGSTAATDYFKRVSSKALTAKFLPVVEGATQKVKLAEQYDKLAGTANSWGLVKDQDKSIAPYVTRKALDGLFVVVAEEEKKFRKDPVSSIAKIIKGLF